MSVDARPTAVGHGEPTGSEQAAPAGQPTRAEVPAAGVPRRILAHLIDLLLVAVCGGAVYLPTSSVVLAVLVGAEVAIAIALWEARSGRTIGKWVLGVRSAQAETRFAPGLRRQAVRAGLLALSHLAALVGQFALIASSALDRTGKGQGLHDRLAATRVIDIRPGAVARPVKVSQPAFAPQGSAAGQPQRGQPQQGQSQTGYGQAPQGYPSQGGTPEVPQGYPQQSPQPHPAQGQPQQGYPQAGQMPQGQPQQGYPQSGQAPQGYPSQGGTPQVPQGYPQQRPQPHPAQGQPQQGYPQPGQMPQGQPRQGYPQSQQSGGGGAVPPSRVGPAPTTAQGYGVPQGQVPPDGGAAPTPQAQQGQDGAHAQPESGDTFVPEDTFFPTAATASPEVPLQAMGRESRDNEPAAGEAHHAAEGAVFVLTIDDGRSVTVSGSGLIGRNPQPRQGEAVDELVAIEDPGRSLSRTHASFGVDGDRFWVEDRGSANGTVVVSAEGITTRVFPGKKVPVPADGRIEIGERVVTVQMWQG